MKTRTKKLSTERQQLSSWVMERADRMCNEYGISRREACRKAHLAKNIVELMGTSVVQFQYRKKDGTLRQARGTLCIEMSPEYDEALRRMAERQTEKSSQKKDENPLDYVTYWDMDKRGFRSFLIRNLDDYLEIKD